MTTMVQVQTQSEYRDLPLDWLVVSPTNPRKTFDEDAMQELAASIRENGVLQPLLVRPRTERSFEIVFGERRYTRSRSPERTFCYRAVYLPLGRWLRMNLPSTQPRLPRIRTIRSLSWKWGRPPIGTSAEVLLRSRQILRQSVPPSRTGLNWRQVCRPFTLGTRRNGIPIFSSKNHGHSPRRPSSCLAWDRNGLT